MQPTPILFPQEIRERLHRVRTQIPVPELQPPAPSPHSAGIPQRCGHHGGGGPDCGGGSRPESGSGGGTRRRRGRRRRGRLTGSHWMDFSANENEVFS